MVQRWRQLANDNVQSSDSATFSLGLPESGYLHSLMIRLEVTNGATSGRNVGPISIPTSIRVVGNGDVRYFDMTPVEIEKWFETFAGRALTGRRDEAASTAQNVVLPVMFGRAPFDPNMFLPLDRIKNPRLEIPYTFTAAADGGFATGTFTINVMALWSPSSDRLSYGGTLVKRTIKTFTSAASGDEETDIDISDPIRTIGVYAYENQVDDETDITAVALKANAGEFNIWQGDWNDFQEATQWLYWAEIRKSYKLLAQNNDYLDVGLSKIIDHTLSLDDAMDTTNDVFPVYNIDDVTGDRLTLAGATATIVAGSEVLADDTTDRIIYLTVCGLSPSYFGAMIYHTPDTPDGYLDPSEFDKLQLVLTQGGAGAAVKIAIEYLMNIQT